MILNTKNWVNVRNCDFVVGSRPILVDGTWFGPGEMVPKERAERTIRVLYELNKVVPVDKPAPKKKRRK